MLERVAVYQTRLRVPGVALDARGVALGHRGLVLLSGLDRLAVFLALYTEARSLESILGSLRIEVVRSTLGASEVVLSFDAGSSDAMDGVADVARMAGGFTFTGTARHYVQYRDAAAPFGYDTSELTATDSALALYHSAFRQTYEIDRRIDLRRFLVGLSPRPDRVGQSARGAAPAHLSKATPAEERRWVLVEPGLGPPFAGYLLRSELRARVTLVSLAREPGIEFEPPPHWLFELAQVPARLGPLLRSTPGLSSFVHAAPGVAVEEGYRHPVNLRSCPVFDPAGLVLLRKGREGPLELARLPALADVGALARVDVREAAERPARVQSTEPPLAVPLRLVRTERAGWRVAATFVDNDELGVLRRLAYLLPRTTLVTTRVALTQAGAYVVCDRGIDSLPVGRFYRQAHPSLYVPLGLAWAPPVSPETLYSALGSPAGQLFFFEADAGPCVAGAAHSGGLPGLVAVPDTAFVSLEHALLEPQRWTPLSGLALAELEVVTPTVQIEPLGWGALDGVRPGR